MDFDATYFNGESGYKQYQNYPHFVARALWVSNNLQGKILELGSAYGYLLEELFNIDESIYIRGVDKSAFAKSQADLSIKDKIYTVDIANADIQTQYDWIISWNVLDCLDSKAHAIVVANTLNSTRANQLHVLSMEGDKYRELGYFIHDYTYWRSLLPNAILICAECNKVYNPTEFKFSQIPLHSGKVTE